MNVTEVARIHERYKSGSVVRTIAPHDAMWKSGRDWYFSVGESGLNCILAGLLLSRLETVTSILELPCGHGRVSRHLRAAFPAAELTFCDLDPSGVDFCAATFAGRGLRSLPELTAVDLGGRFDVIWVGSLFTHVERAKTERWLGFLCQHLNNDGILLASFHGLWAREVHLRHYPMIGPDEWAKIERDCAETGYGFAHHPGQDNGVSLSRASTIVDLCCAIPGTRILAYSERGWAEHQDVVTLARTDRLQDWTSAAIRY